MNNITTNNNIFNYNTQPTLFNIQNQNNTTQTIDGNVRTVTEYNVYMYRQEESYKSDRYNFSTNNFTFCYIIVDATIKKPQENNIAFYQLIEVLQKTDPCIIFNADPNTEIDTINWIYLGSSIITNGLRYQYVLECYDENNNLINPNLEVNIKVKCYPIC